MEATVDDLALIRLRRVDGDDAQCDNRAVE